MLISNNKLYAKPIGEHNDPIKHPLPMVLAKAMCRYQMPDVELVLNAYSRKKATNASHASVVFSCTKDPAKDQDVVLPYQSMLWPRAHARWARAVLCCGLLQAQRRRRPGGARPRPGGAASLKWPRPRAPARPQVVRRRPHPLGGEAAPGRLARHHQRRRVHQVHLAPPHQVGAAPAAAAAARAPRGPASALHRSARLQRSQHLPGRRSRIALLCKQRPDLCDVGFSSFDPTHTTPEAIHEMTEELGLKTPVSMKDMAK